MVLPARGRNGGTWSKRVMILGLKKAFVLLRDPTPADGQAIELVKSIAHTLPVAAASRDGEFTLPPP